MPYMTYSQLKNSAKTRMTPVMGKLIGATAMQIGLTIVILEISSACVFLTPSIPLQTAFYFLLTVLGGMITGMLEAGSSYLFLKLYCNRPITAGDLFHAFSNQAGTCARLSLSLSFIGTVPLMPAQYFSLQLSSMLENMSFASISSNLTDSAATLPPDAMNAMTLALLCYTPALVITTLISLTYSQAYYLMWDFPAYSAKELLKNSRLLMREHKGRLFYIQVCFLPLLLLCIVTFGIGMLWFLPFMYAVQTEFYLDLVTKRSLRNAPIK